MNKNLQAAVEAIQEKFNAELSTFRDQVTLLINKESILDICRILRDDFSFEVLTDATVVDYWRRKQPRFQVAYQLHSRQHDIRIFLRTPVSEDDPSTASLVPIYPNANWYEREIWDLFGIRFAGHPDLRRILLPKGWEGHPLRKDTPLKVEETSFTFNAEEIARGKPRATE